MKGIYHIHSDFSYDADSSVRQIYEWAKGEGLDFVMITEHDNDFDQAKFDRYVAECEAVRDEKVRLIPGIEYSFNKEKKWIHVGVLGVPHFIPNDTKFENLSAFLDKVREIGGISVLNHPIDYYHLIPPELLDKFDVTEVWNTKYDHDYAPNSKNLAMVSRHASSKHFIASSDIHTLPMNKYALVMLNEGADHLDSDAAIINAVKNGKFRCTFGDWVILSSGIVYPKYAYQRILPVLSKLHKRAYDALRKIARRFDYKPSPFVMKLLKLKF